MLTNVYRILAVFLAAQIRYLCECVAPARCHLAYGMWLLFDVTLQCISPCCFSCSAAKHCAPQKHWNSIVSREKCLGLVFKRCVGWGACRLKYLQWRHATASFIRCLTSWTIKLSAMLNQSQKTCFFSMTILHSLFSPRKRDYVSIWNCSYSLTDSGLELKTSHSFNTIWKHVLMQCLVVKEICDC